MLYLLKVLLRSLDNVASHLLLSVVIGQPKPSLPSSLFDAAHVWVFTRMERIFAQVFVPSTTYTNYCRSLRLPSGSGTIGGSHSPSITPVSIGGHHHHTHSMGGNVAAPIYGTVPYAATEGGRSRGSAIVRL
jgi:hypothetical protein